MTGGLVATGRFGARCTAGGSGCPAAGLGPGATCRLAGRPAAEAYADGDSAGGPARFLHRFAGNCPQPQLPGAAEPHCRPGGPQWAGRWPGQPGDTDGNLGWAGTADGSAPVGGFASGATDPGATESGCRQPIRQPPVRAETRFAEFDSDTRPRAAQRAQITADRGARIPVRADVCPRPRGATPPAGDREPTPPPPIRRLTTGSSAGLPTVSRQIADEATSQPDPSRVQRDAAEPAAAEAIHCPCRSARIQRTCRQPGTARRQRAGRRCSARRT